MEHLLVPYVAVKQVERGAVLVFAPHPDDEVFGCGGAIIRHVVAGDSVQVVIVTDGSFLENDADNLKYSKIRQHESAAAAKVLGYGDPVFLGLPDRGIEYGEKLILQLQDEIGKCEPDLIYAPSIFEMHPDHRALGMSVIEAVRRSKKPLKLFMYEVGVPLRPNLLLDISDISEQKKKAMGCFKSQFKIQNYADHIQALNRFRTYTLPKTVTSAEAYMVSTSIDLNDDPFGIYCSEFSRQAKFGLKLDPGNAPLVTVIIRSIGREAYLREALDSVALQTYPNIEVLVVNAKGEGHPELGAWCGRFPLRTCGTGEPLLRSRAANFGLEHAKGEYLIFLDDDDLFDPDHIANLEKTLKENKNHLLAYAGVRVSSNKDGIWNTERFHNISFDPVQLLCHNYIPLHAAMFSRKMLDLGCSFDENLDLCEDWDFWIQISQNTDFLHINCVSATYRIVYSNSNIWSDKSLSRKATIKILEKWGKCWSEDQRFEIARYTWGLYEKSEEIALKEQRQEARIAELETAGQMQGSKVTELEVLGQQLEIKIVEIRKEKDTALWQLNSIFNSKSWRVTRPLRVLHRLFIK